jgi:hypothetical protein
MRAEFATVRARRPTRSHPDGHVVALRALPAYDALFGVDVSAFDPAPVTDAIPDSGPTAGASMQKGSR